MDERNKLLDLIADLDEAYIAHKIVNACAMVAPAPSLPMADRKLYLRIAEDHEEDPYRLVPVSFLKALLKKLDTQAELIRSINNRIDRGELDG